MSAVLLFMLDYLLFIVYLLTLFNFKMLHEKTLSGNQEKGIISSVLLNKEEIF